MTIFNISAAFSSVNDSTDEGGCKLLKRLHIVNISASVNKYDIQQYIRSWTNHPTLAGTLQCTQADLDTNTRFYSIQYTVYILHTVTIYCIHLTQPDIVKLLTVCYLYEYPPV